MDSTGVDGTGAGGATITGIVWDSCPNGFDCEKTYALDGGGVVMRLDRARLLTGDQARALGVDLPDHEMLVHVPTQQWNGGRS